MICIVGALAVDVLIQRERFIKGTSNPASIRFSAGGVGYRIYSHLRVSRMLFTALGSDVFGRWLIERVGQSRWVNALFFEQYPTACYCALMQSGRLLYGAADMGVIERGLSWQRLRGRLPVLEGRDFLILEANLSPALAGELIRHLGGKTRLVFESVSVEKLLRHSEGLRDLYLVCANEAEFRALACGAGGIEKAEDGRRAGSQYESSVKAWLERRNIEQLLVTRGSRGVRLFRRSGRTVIARPTRVVQAADTTGAGDRLLAAYLEALQEGLEAEPALRRAVEAVRRSLEEGSL
jgi:pseudouridine kinase